MKMEISLDDIWVDDYSVTAANIIKTELDSVIRSEVRKLIKEQQKAIAAKVTAAVHEAIKGMSAKHIQAISQKMLGG